MRVLFIALSLATTTAFACPNLSGKYLECRLENGEVTSTNMVVTQSVQNKITTYTIESTSTEGERIREQYVANGKNVIVNEADPDSGIQLQITTKSTCTASALNVNVLLKINGELVADVASTVTKENGRLQLVNKGTSGEEEINEQVTCQ